MTNYQDYLDDHAYEDLPPDIRTQVDAATYQAERRAWRAAQAFWHEVPAPPDAGHELPLVLAAAVRSRRRRRRLPNGAVAAGFLLCFALGGWLFSATGGDAGPAEALGMKTDTVYLERERIIRDTVRLPGREVPVPVLVERTDTVYVPLAEPEPAYAVATESGSDSLLWQFLVPAR
jgi:hypothetical protein